MKKHMFIFFMDNQGMLLQHAVPDRQTVNKEYYQKEWLFISYFKDMFMKLKKNKYKHTRYYWLYQIKY